jgi:urease accessory protein
VKSTASAVVEAGGRLIEVRSGPPLTIRRVRSEDPAICRLCLVNSAAGPLAGDEVSLELTVAAGARAELTSAGAAIAQGRGRTEPGRLISRVTVGGDAELIAEPAPLIVCAGAQVEVELHIDLAASAQLRWTELLVLGRSSEPGGAARIRWNVTRAGRPVLRQLIDLTDPELLAWPGMLGRHRVLASCLISGPDYQAVNRVLDPTAVRQRIDEHTVLVTVLDDDAASAHKRLAELLAF